MSGAWYSAWYLAERLPANLSSPGKLCLLGYAWHFAVLVLGMRIAYGALGPRAGGTGLGALGRLVPYAIGALALLVVLDQIVVRGPLRVPDASVPSFLFMTLLELAFGAALALVAPAAADGHGLRLALRRGWQLARGSRLRLAVLLVLFAFLHWVMFELTLVRGPWVLMANALVVVFKACVLAAAYAKLRGREGPRPEDLGAIFA
jgi:hypothetical protein